MRQELFAGVDVDRQGVFRRGERTGGERTEAARRRCGFVEIQGCGVVLSKFGRQEASRPVRQVSGGSVREDNEQGATARLGDPGREGDVASVDLEYQLPGAEHPILGAGTTDEPQKYSWRDDTIDPCKDYWYYVESISTTGVREKMTPTFKAAAKRSPRS